MQIKNRPEKAAVQERYSPDTTPTTNTIQEPKRTPKKHRARVYMLRTGSEGWTENDILRYCRLSSGRNYASELERRLDICLERTEEKNPDGIGAHMRYLKALAAGGSRFNLQAEPAGKVTPEQRQLALDTLAAMKKKEGSACA